MNNQDSELKDFFQKYKREIPDNGFSEKVAEKIRFDIIPLWYYVIITGSLLLGIIILWFLGFWKALPHYISSFMLEVQNFIYQIVPLTTLNCNILFSLLSFGLFLLLFWYVDRIRQW